MQAQRDSNRTTHSAIAKNRVGFMISSPLRDCFENSIAYFLFKVKGAKEKGGEEGRRKKESVKHPEPARDVLVGDGGFVTTNFPHRCGKWTAVVNGGSSPNRKRFRTTAAAAFLISTISDQNKGIPRGYAFILVGDGGFGPPKSATTDLQSAPFGHSGNLPYKSSRCVNSLELVIGVEPTTC